MHADPLFIRAEIDRRLELFGVSPYDRHHDQHHDQHRGDSAPPPVAAHPLVAFVARLVGGRATTTRPDAAHAPSTASRRPRHP